MSRARVRSGVAGLTTLLVFVLVLAVWGPPERGESNQQAAQPPRRVRAEGKPIPMPANLISLEVALGLKDKQPTAWDGQVQLSQGKVIEIDVLRGGPNAKAEGNRFTARSVLGKEAKKKKKEVVDPILLRVTLDAPAAATVTLETKQGKFAFKPADLPVGSPRTFLDEQARVERQDGAIRLTGRDTEDDFPVLARDRDGAAWLAYVEYQPGRPMVLERVYAREFDELVPTGHGDQIRLTRFDGKVWQPAIDVTEPGLDVWRPTVAVDGQGRVVVAWAQQVDHDWEIFYRRYTPGKDGGKGQWSEVVRLTRSPGSDFHVVAATDANGVVWLAWQGWRNANFEILLTALDDKPREPRVISTSKANDWSPAIAADAKGNVYVAWDTYDKGNYDVMLHQTGKETKTIPVAASARFEARPHLVCDAAGRLWIAYEEGDEQWGKDFATAQFQRVPLAKNPGFALYINRTVKVKCLADGKLMQPAGDLEKALATRLNANKSVPRLAVDPSGGLWLLVRHHPLPSGAGEVWNSFALRYDGKRWTEPRRLPGSENLMDNRPALVPFAEGILAVYSGDGRQRTQNRDQDDLFAAILSFSGTAQAPELIADSPVPAAQLPPVHPNEAAEVARLRNYRVEIGGKKLRPLRGEFHRHTEYTSHRDGDGLLEDAWRYGLDAGALDWMGDGDHDNGFGHEYMWWLIQKYTDLMHNPPHFIAAYTYERSVVYPNGHRNVILPRRGIRPLPRGDLTGTPEKGTPDTKLLYAYLKHFGGICASHTSATNMGTDWRDNDPVVEPIVEIYQGHRHNYEEPNAPRAPTAATQIGGFEPAGFVWNALNKGIRFGFQSSSDHISTHMSYAVPLVEEVSRQGIIDAFKKRHTYAATDNILLEVRSGDHLMGDAFETKQRPTLQIKVHGTAPVAKVHVIREGKYVYTAEPKKAEVELRYTDAEVKPGTYYYYVRVEQADGNLAWGSPMWITYKP
ncbi:MAG TPA: hypothetical protein VNK04_06545 [Gemmataceae bacterium]|nr:hypothetical protein [Gemmataceae bacterium]